MFNEITHQVCMTNCSIKRERIKFMTQVNEKILDIFFAESFPRFLSPALWV